MHGILIAIHTFNIGSINKVRVAYYKRMKKFFRAIVAFNITQMLVELRLSSFFDTMRASSSIAFNNSLACSTNLTVCHSQNVDV